MKYTTEILLEKPVDKVVDLFDNSENLKKWQPGLVSFEHIRGEAGKPGSKSKLKYEMGKREVEMIETILNHNLPEEFSSTYEADGVFNKVSHRFISISDGKTQWMSDNEFKFKGFMKLMAIFMPGAFKKQTKKHMQQFKKFVENS